MTKCQNDPTCGIFLKRGLFKDIKIKDILMCQMCKYKKYKYTNTAYNEVLKRPNKEFFETRIFQGCKKNYSHFICYKLYDPILHGIA